MTEPKQPLTEKTYCPAKCGKLYITKEHAYAHANEEHHNWDKPEMQKRKGWVTPHGFADYTEPVTYKQACEDMEKITKDLFKKGN